jgi:hypothetical protein
MPEIPKESREETDNNNKQSQSNSIYGTKYRRDHTYATFNGAW